LRPQSYTAIVFGCVSRLVGRASRSKRAIGSRDADGERMSFTAVGRLRNPCRAR